MNQDLEKELLSQITREEQTIAQRCQEQGIQPLTLRVLKDLTCSELISVVFWLKGSLQSALWESEGRDAVRAGVRAETIARHAVDTVLERRDTDA